MSFDHCANQTHVLLLFPVLVLQTPRQIPVCRYDSITSSKAFLLKTGLECCFQPRRWRRGWDSSPAGEPGLGSEAPPALHSLPRPSNPFILYQNKIRPPGRTLFWRRGWDSNPCALSRKLISSKWGSGSVRPSSSLFYHFSSLFFRRNRKFRGSWIEK